MMLYIETEKKLRVSIPNSGGYGLAQISAFARVFLSGMVSF